MRKPINNETRPKSAKLLMSGDFIDAKNRTRRFDVFKCYGAYVLEIGGDPGQVGYESLDETLRVLNGLMTSLAYCESIRNATNQTEHRS